MQVAGVCLLIQLFFGAPPPATPEDECAQVAFGRDSTAPLLWIDAESLTGPSLPKTGIFVVPKLDQNTLVLADSCAGLNLKGMECVSRDGRYFARVAGREFLGPGYKTRIELLSTSEGQPQVLSIEGEEQLALALSDDGRFFLVWYKEQFKDKVGKARDQELVLIYENKDGTLDLVHKRAWLGGLVERRPAISLPTWASWSKGANAFVVMADGRFWAVAVDTMRWTKLGRFASVAISPDGQYLARHEYYGPDEPEYLIVEGSGNKNEIVKVEMPMFGKIVWLDQQHVVVSKIILIPVSNFPLIGKRGRRICVVDVQNGSVVETRIEGHSIRLLGVTESCD